MVNKLGSPYPLSHSASSPSPAGKGNAAPASAPVSSPKSTKENNRNQQENVTSSSELSGGDKVGGDTLSPPTATESPESGLNDDSQAGSDVLFPQGMLQAGTINGNRVSPDSKWLEGFNSKKPLPPPPVPLHAYELPKNGLSNREEIQINKVSPTATESPESGLNDDSDTTYGSYDSEYDSDTTYGSYDSEYDSNTTYGGYGLKEIRKQWLQVKELEKEIIRIMKPEKDTFESALKKLKGIMSREDMSQEESSLIEKVEKEIIRIMNLNDGTFKFVLEDLDPAKNGIEMEQGKIRRFYIGISKENEKEIYYDGTFLTEYDEGWDCYDVKRMF
ncbi:MAG: hypothetical protein NQ127_02805 [Candidatus Cardinium sp.]|nr:hypothetical protein [Candidatus Cardinium sp.]